MVVVVVDGGDNTYHGTLTEVSRIGKILVLVEKVLQHGDTTVKVDVHTFAQFLLALDGSHHCWLRDGIFRTSPVLVLGVVNELAQLLVEVERNVEIQISAFVVKMDQRNTLGSHISIFNNFPSNAVCRERRVRF